MDSAKTTRESTTPPNELRVLAGWREEIRTFLERTLQEIQQIVAGLQAKPRDPVPDRPVESRAPTTTAARSDFAGRGEVDDPMDASRTRLENLKRRLSEKLRTQQTTGAGETDRLREEPGA